MESNQIFLEKMCYEIPKAELHVHIEGTFEPELMFEIAKRNQIKISYKSVEEIKAKYLFNNLQEFLDIYYAACDVLIKTEDFEDLAYAYLQKSSTQGLKYAEIFFDPQTHTKRGVSFGTVINGLKKGLKRGQQDFGIETNLIMCFLRDLTEEEAFQTLEEALPFKDDILSIGLDSAEVGNPPEKFKNVYKEAKSKGFRLCAHAGEEGTAQDIENAIKYLQVERIDHGIQITGDKQVLNKCVELKIPFTLCPLSNYKLKATPDLTKYRIRELLNENLLVMLNSDDPAYFGGYIGDNYLALLKSLKLNHSEISLLAANSFKATFLCNERKEYYLKFLEDYLNKNKEN